MLKKIDVYILKAIIVSFFISLAIVSAVMMIGDIIKIYDILFARGSSLETLFKILLYITIFLSIFTIPMALTIAINYVYSEMSNSSEITALRSSGINLYRIYLPAFFITLAIFVFLFYDVSFLAYKSRLNYKNELEKTFRNKIYIGLKPDMFYNNLGGTLWVEKLSSDHRNLYHVFFADKNEVFIAKSGILNDIKNGILAKFESVKLFSKKSGSYEYGRFKEYDLAFLLAKGKKKKGISTKYMTLSELYNYYKKTKDKEAIFKINKMISLSLSVFPLSIIAFSLGITFSRSGKSAGIAISLLLFFVFYILLMLGQSLFKSKGWIIPIYMPNIVLTLFGFYIFYKKVKV